MRKPQSGASRIISEIEETFIAILLGAMTLVTFAAVVARYVFNSGILWALETTVFLFAWLVLIGVSYCVKVNALLGVDIVAAALPRPARRIFGLLAVAASLAFAVLICVGSWEYWLPFVGTRSWYEVNDIPAFEAVQWLAPYLNDGERWDKLPRFIPYMALPLGMTLLIFRLLQAGWRVWTGQQDMIVASHEVEEALADLKQKSGEK
ncbi:MAG: TRAP transporter small permease [Hyphomicrobiales bacterium]|nr:TRAP transporter small permease [Hyphomicrobiales bacterium]